MEAILTPEWFLRKAEIGVAVGYILRMVEHITWRIGDDRPAPLRTHLSDAVVFLIQSMAIGTPLAYLATLLLAHTIQTENVLTIVAMLASLFFAFLAADLRELLRRITRM